MKRLAHFVNRDWVDGYGRCTWAVCSIFYQDKFYHMLIEIIVGSLRVEIAGCECGWEKTCAADRHPSLKLGKKVVDQGKMQALVLILV